MAEYPVTLGSILLTLVEPHPGYEIAYNRWYERDHFYAGCLVGPGILAGARWVATREMKALRFPDDSPIVPHRAVGSSPGDRVDVRVRLLVRRSHPNRPILT